MLVISLPLRKDFVSYIVQFNLNRSAFYTASIKFLYCLVVLEN